MSSNKGAYNGQPPKYINDFSKALAGEVRILLAEVGQLRDERRQLQHEIAELMSVKSRFGGGGEYSGDPNWAAKQIEPPPPEAPPAEPPVPAGPAPGGWRTVHKRAERVPRAIKAARAAAAAAPPPAIEAPKPPPNLPAWAQWRPNPLIAPVPRAGAAPPSPAPPERLGLFGPPTPPPK